MDGTQRSESETVGKALQAFLGYAEERERLEAEAQPRTWRRDDLYDA